MANTYDRFNSLDDNSEIKGFTNPLYHNEKSGNDTMNSIQDIVNNLKHSPPNKKPDPIDVPDISEIQGTKRTDTSSPFSIPL